MPPPCIIVDGKKLLDIAKQHAQEIQKIQETVNTIKQAKAATDTIIAEVRDPLKMTLRIVNADTNTGPIFPKISGDIAALAQKTSDQLFSGSSGTADETQATDTKRRVLAKDANAEAYAYGVQKTTEGEKTNTRLAELSQKACKSKDLRGDWAANSEIKLEIMTLREQQAYLLTSFLRLQSANNAVSMPKAMPTAFQSGKISSIASAAVPAISKSLKVGELIDIVSTARSIMGSLGVVQMTGSVQQTLNGVVADYQNTVDRKANLTAQLYSAAQRWSNASGRGSAQNTVSVILNALNQMDIQQAAVRAQPIETLAGAFATRNIDAATLMQSDVDPRQFIGTWTDPLKYKNTLDLSNSLLQRNGLLDSSITGRGDDELRQLVYDYNDVRLEEAWKKVLVDGDPNDPVNNPGARAQLAQAAGTISEENALQGSTVDEASATKQLQDLVQKANALGGDISSGEDDGAKTQAADLLKQLQDLVGGGTSLPAVDVSLVTTTPTTPGMPDPSAPDVPIDPRTGIQP